MEVLVKAYQGYGKAACIADVRDDLTDILISFFVSPGGLANHIRHAYLPSYLKYAILDRDFEGLKPKFSFIPQPVVLQDHKLESFIVRVEQGCFRGLSVQQVISNSGKLWPTGSIINARGHLTGERLTWLHRDAYWLDTGQERFYVFEVNNKFEYSGFVSWTRIYESIRKEMKRLIVHEGVTPEIKATAHLGDKSAYIVKTHNQID